MCIRDRCTGFLALATVVTALPTTPVHAESKQYWTESAERVGIIEKVMTVSYTHLDVYKRQGMVHICLLGLTESSQKNCLCEWQKK